MEGPFFITDKINYVNEMSIWTSYCMFCLAWVFSKMLAVSHRYQANKSKYPKTKILPFHTNPNIFLFKETMLFFTC
ncbi:hypothetical protein BAU27_11635 [Bacillus sp. NH11B]|nr:hypothetical protein BAU27_11635 [Bacillus sp. NH11B]